MSKLFAAVAHLPRVPSPPPPPALPVAMDYYSLACTAHRAAHLHILVQFGHHAQMRAAGLSTSTHLAAPLRPQPAAAAVWAGHSACPAAGHSATQRNRSRRWVQGQFGHCSIMCDTLWSYCSAAKSILLALHKVPSLLLCIAGCGCVQQHLSSQGNQRSQMTAAAAAEWLAAAAAAAAAAS